jgi:hypothetical protein
MLGGPVLRNVHVADIEKIRESLPKGTSVRNLAKDFETTQWMKARLLTPKADGTLARADAALNGFLVLLFRTLRMSGFLTVSNPVELGILVTEAIADGALPRNWGQFI